MATISSLEVRSPCGQQRGHYLLKMGSPRQSRPHPHGLLSLSWVSSLMRHLDETEIGTCRWGLWHLRRHESCMVHIIRHSMTDVKVCSHVKTYGFQNCGEADFRKLLNWLRAINQVR